MRFKYHLYSRCYGFTSHQEKSEFNGEISCTKITSKFLPSFFFKPTFPLRQYFDPALVGFEALRSDASGIARHLLKGCLQPLDMTEREKNRLQSISSSQIIKDII